MCINKGNGRMQRQRLGGNGYAEVGRQLEDLIGGWAMRSKLVEEIGRMQRYEKTTKVNSFIVNLPAHRLRNSRRCPGVV